MIIVSKRLFKFNALFHEHASTVFIIKKKFIYLKLSKLDKSEQETTRAPVNLNKFIVVTSINFEYYWMFKKNGGHWTCFEPLAK